MYDRGEEIGEFKYYFEDTFLLKCSESFFENYLVRKYYYRSGQLKEKILATREYEIHGVYSFDSASFEPRNETHYIENIGDSIINVFGVDTSLTKRIVFFNGKESYNLSFKESQYEDWSLYSSSVKFDKSSIQIVRYIDGEKERIEHFKE